MRTACPHCGTEIARHSPAADSTHCYQCGRLLVRDLRNSTRLRGLLQHLGELSCATPVRKPINDSCGEPLPHTAGISCATPPPASSTEARRPSGKRSPLSETKDTDCMEVDGTAISRVTPLTPAVLPEIPGYELERVLGRGGMGTVYLARQVSLQRPVALKVMSRKWSGDPAFVSRFMREALAAARLNHPNLVQVYDIGEANGLRYFSMEYVDGRSLADVVRSAGRLDPEIAVSYVLQAARGLHHAHERGMIHRDVKPDNLLLDSQGLIKVADLGLVKAPQIESESVPEAVGYAVSGGVRESPSGTVTGVRMALGTPAYMSPEQCRDAATVDQRSDIYSLGCTLYALVTGKQPFDGNTPVELMSQHAYAPPVPPEELATRVPPALSAIIQRMMAKQPSERYGNMAEVIRVLEQWLGVQQASGRFTAGEQQIAELELCVARFHNAPTALLRSKILTGAVTLCLIAAVICCFLGRIGWAFGLAGMILQAALVYFILDGATRGTSLYRRLSRFVCSLGVGDLLVALALAALFAILLWMLKLFWMWIGFGLIGTALAFLLRFGLDRAVDAERLPMLRHTERLLRRLRVLGMDEDQLRLFVAKYGGRYWEEFFEALFGYESKLEVRERLMRGGAAGIRERHAAWREPIILLLDSLERQRRERAERELLFRTEQARLRAEGFTRGAARRIAAQAVDSIMNQPAAYSTRHLRSITPSSFAFARDSGVLKQYAASRLETDAHEERASRQFNLALFCQRLGVAARAALGVVCVLACFAWAWQNQVLNPWSAETAAYEPLHFPGIAPEYTTWIDCANIGVAGMLLLASAFYTGVVMCLLVFCGAAVAATAHHFGIPAVPPIHDYHVGLTLGSAIALLGYRFGR